MTVSLSVSLVSSSSSVRIRDGSGRTLPVGFGSSRACITPESFGSPGSEAETDAGVSMMRATERGSGYLLPRFSVAPMMDWTNNHFRTIARLMSKHAWLYTEMVVDDTIIYQQDNLDVILKFPESQHPIVLQLGGCNPNKLFKASQLASLYGYDEINLNCGCPSDNVTGRSFGAALMLEPELVGQCVTAIAKGSPGTSVSVKCRIGVDDFDSFDFLHNFIRIVSSTSPTKHFIIHARKAVLKGLNPDENRRIPPLKYEYVFALMRDFPNLKFTLNGGVANIHQVNEALNRGVFGVMLGRTAYNSPWSVLANVDRVVYGDITPVLTRRQILEKYVVYGDAELHRYGYKKPGIRQIAQPLSGLFYREKGVGSWRRALDEYIRSSQTLDALLRATLRVIPDSVLDSPPKLEESAVTLFSDLPVLPSAQSRGSSRIILPTKQIHENQIPLGS